jgi:hypothetical protein
VARVQLFRSERRVREQAVPVVPVVQTTRAGAVRAALVTTSMWQRGGGKGAPENDRMVSVATARILRRCLNSTGYRVDLPLQYGR